MHEARDILGLPVLAATQAEAVALLDRELADRRPVLVAFLNAHLSNLAARDAALAGILREALVLNDGVGMDLASRILHGKPFPANLNGTDFVPAYLAATRHAFRIYAIGSADGVAQRALDELRKAAPQHTYLGARDGFFADDAGVALQVAASGADLVLAGMGSPRQEMWSARHLAVAGGPSVLCVGGLLDFMSGTKPRAPALLRRLRLEWVFRLMLEPGRMWRRYIAGNAVFMGRLCADRLRARRG